MLPAPPSDNQDITLKYFVLIVRSSILRAKMNYHLLEVMSCSLDIDCIPFNCFQVCCTRALLFCLQKGAGVSSLLKIVEIFQVEKPV